VEINRKGVILGCVFDGALVAVYTIVGCATNGKIQGMYASLLAILGTCLIFVAPWTIFWLFAKREQGRK